MTAVAELDGRPVNDHIAPVRATVYDQSGYPYTVRVEDGTVEADATADVRRRCSNVVITGAVPPTTRSALLAPLGNEIQLERGIVLPDGTAGIWPLGVFGIDTSEVSEDSAGIRVVLSGQDRAKTVADNGWDSPYQVTAGANAAAAIQALITDRFPAAAFNFAATTVTLPGLLFGTSDQDNDPWKAAEQMATAAGLELFVDPNGTFTLRPPVSTVSTAPTWAFGDGQVRLLGVNVKLSRDKSYTRVVAYSMSSAGTPLQSIAALPSDAPRTFYYTTRAALTQAQLDTVAQALLTKVSGAFTDISFDAVPDPRLDVDTVGTITRSSIGVTGRYILDKLSIGLAPSARMTGTVRGDNLG